MNRQENARYEPPVMYDVLIDGFRVVRQEDVKRWTTMEIHYRQLREAIINGLGKVGGEQWQTLNPVDINEL